MPRPCRCRHRRGVLRCATACGGPHGLRALGSQRARPGQRAHHTPACASRNVFWCASQGIDFSGLAGHLLGTQITGNELLGCRAGRSRWPAPRSRARGAHRRQLPQLNGPVSAAGGRRLDLRQQAQHDAATARRESGGGNLAGPGIDNDGTTSAGAVEPDARLHRRRHPSSTRRCVISSASSTSSSAAAMASS